MATDVNLALVSSGHAWWHRQFTRNQPLQDRMPYGHAQFNAKQTLIGLWADDNPIPPWAWRKGKAIVADHADTPGPH